MAPSGDTSLLSQHSVTEPQLEEGDGSELAHELDAPCPPLTTKGKRKTCGIFQEYLLSGHCVLLCLLDR